MVLYGSPTAEPKLPAVEHCCQLHSRITRFKNTITRIKYGVIESSFVSQENWHCLRILEILMAKLKNG